jgi:hypothetical protein
VLRNYWVMGMVTLLIASLLTACAQEDSSSGSSGEFTSSTSGNTSESEGGGGSASGGGGSASKGSSDNVGQFQGIVDSYGVAQEEIDAEGGEQRAGGYRVGYIIEPAEGWWEGDPQNLAWREPAPGETNHIEILPFEVGSGLLVPEAEITLTVLDESGNEVDSKSLRFYRGEFYHYANNFSLPGSGAYTLRAEIAPPTFLRHETDEAQGRVFTDPVTAEFENVEIDTEGE